MPTVLIVDEDDDTRAALVEILEAQGLTVLTESIADEAAEVIAAGGIDLAVTEIELPYYGNRPTGFIPGTIVTDAAHKTNTPVVINSFSSVSQRSIGATVVRIIMKPQRCDRTARLIIDALPPQPT